MRHRRHFESAPASRGALQIGELIADIDRVVHILNSDIATEEEQAKVFDRSQPEYPMLARTLAARRDNLRETIAALERRLAAIYRAQLEEVSAQQQHGASKPLASQGFTTHRGTRLGAESAKRIRPSFSHLAGVARHRSSG
jgi:ABC-type transporter Mla subunit MlaD